MLHRHQFCRWAARFRAVLETPQLQHRQCCSDGWLRPTVPREEYLDRLQHKGICIMGLAVRFSASRSITEQEARTVMLAVNRRIFNLRLCFGHRDGRRWVRQMPEEKIDFEVVYDADPALQYSAMVHRGFDSDSGPLWSARLLPWSDKSVPLEYSFQTSQRHLNEDSQSLQQPPASKHPYRYHLLTSYHHALMDGYSSLVSLNLALTLFSRLLEGKPLGEHKQVGEFFDMSKKERACAEISQTFVDNPELLESRKKAAEECLARPLFLDAFPVKYYKKPSTDIIFNGLDEQKTKVFLALCKQNSVTVHTGFCSIINIAIVDMLREAGVQQDSNKISTWHFTEQRPFFPRSKESLGYCVGTISAMSVVPSDAQDNFWSYVKKNHQDFKKRSKSNQSLEEFVLSSTTDFGTKPNFETLPGMIEPTTYYYSTTNLLDVTKFFNVGGNTIDVEWVDGINSIHRGTSVWMHSFCTYRGRFLHTMYYNTGLMDRTTAEILVRKIFGFMEKLTEIEQK